MKNLEREAFENAMRDNRLWAGSLFEREAGPDSVYINTMTAVAWMVWQDAREITKETEVLFKFYNVNTCADLIEVQARHIEQLQEKLRVASPERPIEYNYRQG